MYYFLDLLRFRQWYKNLVIFLAVIFSGNLLNSDLLVLSSAGFLVLCVLSSASYLLNDIVDVRQDRYHPVKRLRPVASGRVSVPAALATAVLLASLALVGAFMLSTGFFLILLALFVLTQVYTAWLKHEPIADILLICAFFVLRAVSGAVLIAVHISPWLIVGTFFLALFLASGKRHAEVRVLGSRAASHRPVLEHYTTSLTQSLLVISTALLVLSYAMYTFLSQHPLLVVTIPLGLYPVIRYFQLVLAGSRIAEEPSLVVGDLRMLIGGVLWTVAVLAVLYAM